MTCYTVGMNTVAILSGGDSDEREVSLRSGASVAAALAAPENKSRDYDVVMIDLRDDFAAQKATVQQANVIFPVLHGRGGEDGTIQKQLEDWGVAFVGSDSAASERCFDKWQYKQFVRKHDVLVPAGELVNSMQFVDCPFSKKPFVLKPFNGGSSVDTLIVRDRQTFDPAVLADIFTRHPSMLLEELIDGIEVTVGVLGATPTPLPVIEIIPPASGEFDYENKYNGQSQELCPPQHIPKDIQVKLQDIARTVHKLCGCRDLSRSDFMITASGEIYLLETNTMPGLTDQSLFPKAASVAGLAMPVLIDSLVQTALVRDR